MKANIGSGDQTLRLVVGIVLLSLVLIVDSDWRWLGLIGLAPLLTAVVRVCPLYSILGVNTCHRETDHV
jgi:hypothetical protein